MAYARYSPERPTITEKGEKQRQLPIGRLLGRVFGYMAIALVVTGGVAFGLAALFVHGLQWTIDRGQPIDYHNGVVIAYLVIMGVSFVALLIDSFVMSRMVATGRHSIWAPFLIYAVLMGILMSTFVLFVDLFTLAEAFGITAATFGIMFLIGYFSKVNLNPLGLVAMGFLLVMVLLGAFWGIFYAMNPAGFYVWDLVFSLIVCVLFLIIAAVDSYNIRKILEKGDANDNICLFCAFTMYTDFISILIRVIYILAIINGRRD